MDVLDYTGLNIYDDNMKDYIKDALEASSPKIRGEITFDDVRNALGYTPSSATELAEIRFTMNEEDGHLIMLYPDKSSIPDVVINSSGHLIYTY